MNVTASPNCTTATAPVAKKYVRGCAGAPLVAVFRIMRLRIPDAKES
jgi:hypothetical protein